MIITKQSLSRFDFTMLMITLVIGMGIFRTPATVAAEAHTPVIFFAVWIFGGIIAICGALTFAEIGSRYPVTGCFYKIFSYAYHPSIAFGINCIILISDATSVAGIAIIGAEYIAKVLIPNTKDTSTIQITIAISSIIILYFINLAGLKTSAKTQNILTIIKISFVVLLISPLFFYTNSNHVLETANTISPTLKEYLKAFGLGLISVSFTYGGYQQSINFGAEVRNPSKNIPKSIITGLLIIIVLYLTINYAFYKVIGFNELKTSSNIAALMASHVFGESAGNVLSILLFLGVLAYANAQLMVGPRIMEAMSQDGVLPKTFEKRTAKKNVLVASLSLFASLIILTIFWAKTFDEILSFSIFLDCFGMVLAAATIFKFRKTNTNLNGSEIFQMKIFPLLPIVFMITYTFIAVVIFINKPYTGLLGITILAAFIVLYFIIQSFKKRNNKL